jgi:Uma2 family endonuclease
MARAGILKSREPVELIEGLLVRKMSINPPHTYATGHLHDLLRRMLPSGWFINEQSPITTTDSEPEPDLAVIRGDRRQYLVQDRHPGPADTEILIEVSDSSLAFDRTTKLQVYARAGVPQYWVVSIPDRGVEVHTGPTGPGTAPSYQHRQDFIPGQEIPVLLADREVGRVQVAELFL